MDLVTVQTFADSAEAHLFRMRLETEGIPAFVAHEYFAKLYSGALGGAKVQVPVELLDDARHVWKMCRAGAFAETLSEAVDEDEENSVSDAAQESVLLPIVFTLLVLIVMFAVLMLPKLLSENDRTRRHETLTFPFSRVPQYQGRN